MTVPLPATSVWWENHYRRGKTSGPGSQGVLLRHKADVLRPIVDGKSVTDFGVGDGRLLELLSPAQYLGLDVSPAALELASTADPSRSFELYTPGMPLDRTDIALSIDVLYHIVEQDLYHLYLEDLFNTAPTVVIYSTNHDEQSPDLEHVCMRHRHFTQDTPTGWTYTHQPGLAACDWYTFFQGGPHNMTPPRLRRRPCWKCGDLTIGPSCSQCKPPPPTNPERVRRRQAVQDWITQYGDVCPGYQVDMHHTPTHLLEADHITPRNRAGEDSPLQVLCKSCNSRKQDGLR